MVDENSNDKNDLLLGSDFNKKIINKLEKIKNRYDEINKKLEIPENYKITNYLRNLIRKKLNYKNQMTYLSNIKRY